MKLNAILALLVALSGCATSQHAKARQAAVIQKTSVDGIGASYLQYCEVVRTPNCVDADDQARKIGTPWSKEDRVQCLRPCDSKTAAKIRDGVDLVRTAQTALFFALKREASDEELAQSREQLRNAAAQLWSLLEQTGVLDVIQSAVGGPSGSSR